MLAFKEEDDPEVRHPTVDKGFELAVIERLAREFPERMEIRWDEAEQVVMVGKWKIHKYTNFKSLN